MRDGDKKKTGIVDIREPLYFISEKTETSGNEIVNPFNDMTKISKLYLFFVILIFRG